jgi:hypothetical protein
VLPVTCANDVVSLRGALDSVDHPYCYKFVEMYWSYNVEEASHEYSSLLLKSFERSVQPKAPKRIMNEELSDDVDTGKCYRLFNKPVCAL